MFGLGWNIIGNKTYIPNILGKTQLSLINDNQSIVNSFNRTVNLKMTL